MKLTATEQKLLTDWRTAERRLSALHGLFAQGGPVTLPELLDGHLNVAAALVAMLEHAAAQEPAQINAGRVNHERPALQ